MISNRLIQLKASVRDDPELNIQQSSEDAGNRLDLINCHERVQDETFFCEINEDILKTTSAGRNIFSLLLENAITTEILMDAQLSLILWIMAIMEAFKQKA